MAATTTVRRSRRNVRVAAVARQDRSIGAPFQQEQEARRSGPIARRPAPALSRLGAVFHPREVKSHARLVADDPAVVPAEPSDLGARLEVNVRIADGFHREY
jgi:hypothetical protein